MYGKLLCIIILEYNEFYIGVDFMSDKNECPICGCSEIGQGKHIAQGKMMPINTVFTSGSVVIADICTNCGHILSMRVENPEKFK